MTTEQAITILREHNKWRRGIPPYDEVGNRQPYSAKDIGIAIDTVVEHFADVSKSSLTWQDIAVIVEIADEVITKEKVEYSSKEEYYSEVLRRYQEGSK